MKVGDLRGADYNPRKISEADLASLKQRLEVFGDLGGIVFNRKTGNLIGGHQRVKTLDPSWPIFAENLPTPDKCGTIARGYIKTPFGELSFRIVDWEEKIERAANVAANNPAGEWDDAKLKELLTGLDDGSGMLDLTGFSAIDLQGLIDRAPTAPLPSEADHLFESITFTVSKEQLSIIGFALDQAIKSGPFDEAKNANRRGNALARIAEAYRNGK